jgi:hypothetical protein
MGDATISVSVRSGVCVYCGCVRGMRVFVCVRV